MVSNLKPHRLNVNDTLLMKRQAEELLERLQADRDCIEQRLVETGKRDPIRTVTGQTALDSAIASARQMISHLDQILAEAATAVQPAAPLVQFPAKRVLKPQVRIGMRFPTPAAAAPVSSVAS